MVNRKFIASDKFKAQLYEGSNLINEQTITPDKGFFGEYTNTASFMFDKITYKEPGQHTYTVKETGEAVNVTNDTRTYTVVVDVVKDPYNSGKLIATASTGEKGINFVNTYNAEGTTTFHATKVANGFDLKEKQFKFELKDSTGKVIDEATNDKDGNVGPIGDTVKDAVKDAVNNGNNFNGVMVSAAFFF